MMGQDKPKDQLMNELLELRKQCSFYKNVLDQLPVCTIFYDQSEKVIYRNRASQRIDGYSDRELLGYSREDYLKKLQIKPGGTEVRIEPPMNKSNFKDGIFGFTETTLLTKEGSLKNVLLVENFIRDEENNLMGACGCAVDISKHVQKSQQFKKNLLSSEGRFSKAFHFSPVIMTIIRVKDWWYIDANKAFLEYTGFSREEVIGFTPHDLDIWPETNEQSGEYIIGLIKEKGAFYNEEVKIRNKSGEIRVGLASVDTIKINDEDCLLCVLQDVTEKRTIEKEMARLERLNLIGEMAAGISHEIRNPMTTIRGFIQLFSEKPEFQKHKGSFDLMIEELDRANSIITEFLSLARNKTVDRKLLNLNSIIGCLLPLIQADAIKNDIGVNLELEEVPNLFVDQKEIRQLILNLVRNGFEAMSPGGMVVIKTFVDGENIVLAVKDSGTGIQPDVVEKIGTPFFTTKENGTGLGMSICYAIAARHNARIDIETGSHGTTFFVRFQGSQ